MEEAITIRAPSIVAETHVTKMQTKEEVLCFNSLFIGWKSSRPSLPYNKEKDIHCVEQNTV